MPHTPPTLEAKGTSKNALAKGFEPSGSETKMQGAERSFAATERWVQSSSAEVTSKGWGPLQAGPGAPWLCSRLPRLPSPAPSLAHSPGSVLVSYKLLSALIGQDKCLLLAIKSFA